MHNSATQKNLKFENQKKKNTFIQGPNINP